MTQIVRVPKKPIEVKHLIAGDWCSSDRTVDVVSPYTGISVGTVSLATPDDVDRAARAAHEEGAR